MTEQPQSDDLKNIVRCLLDLIVSLNEQNKILVKHLERISDSLERISDSLERIRDRLEEGVYTYR